MNVRNVKPQIDSYFMHVTCDKSYFSSTKSTQIITPFFVGKKEEEEGKKIFHGITHDLGREISSTRPYKNEGFFLFFTAGQPCGGSSFEP